MKLRQMKWIGMALALAGVPALAQTAVTTTPGGTATSGTIPVFGPGSTIQNSGIVQLGDGTLNFESNQVTMSPSGNINLNLTTGGSAGSYDFGITVTNSKSIAGRLEGLVTHAKATSSSVTDYVAGVEGRGWSYVPSGQTTAWTGTLCGGDYAESVDVTGDRKRYSVGDVLVIDPEAPGKFLLSAEPYSTSVMGVYSTKPGALGRRQTTPKDADEIPMAMIGIVPTKVSTENGSIKPGDLLVTSSTVGYAMKGTDRSRMLGAVIGKALGRLDSGTGVIEVGIVLQ